MKDNSDMNGQLSDTVQIVKTLYEDYIALAQKATSNPCSKCKWNNNDADGAKRCDTDSKEQKHCTMAKNSGFEYIHAEEVETLIKELERNNL